MKNEMNDAAIDGRDGNTGTVGNGRDGNVCDGNGRDGNVCDGNVCDGNGGDDFSVEARIMLLEYNIECLDRLIGRYGGNRSLANIRTSEYSILTELLKSLGK